MPLKICELIEISSVLNNSLINCEIYIKKIVKRKTKKHIEEYNNIRKKTEFNFIICDNENVMSDMCTFP